MTAFARPSLLDSRYAVIAETSAYTYDDDLVNYADFLRNHSRYKTKDGYVDSSRRIRSLNRQQDELDSPKNYSSPLRTGLLASINHQTSSSAPTSTTPTRKTKRLGRNKSRSSLSNSPNLLNKKREYDKQMRVIEEQMIKAKQREREAKRLEGDIKKERRQIQHSLRELDVDTTRKRYSADKNLSKNLEEKDRIERDFVKTREKQTKQRTDRTIDSLQAHKDKDRRNLLLCNDLARQYRTKTNELDIKHQQVDRIHSDFEQKIQQKELEENRLKKELADIAMALNLEAQKAKNDLNDFLNIVEHDRNQTIRHDLDQDQRLNQINGHGRNHGLEKRRHSGDLSYHRSVLDGKQREALRRIGDTKDRLESIYAKQRQLNASVAVAEQDRRAAHLMSKMTDIESRRSQLMNQHLREKSDEHASNRTDQVKTPHTELEAKNHEDQLRYLEKVIHKNEEIEYELRKSVKEAEFQRRKKEQEVQRLKEDLIRKKRDDAKKIHEAIARSQQEEQELERNLTKAKEKLIKLQTKREGNHTRLTEQRKQMRESKDLLNTHEREHERLLHVQSQSQSLQSLSVI